MKKTVDALIDGTIPGCQSEGRALYDNFLGDNEQFLVLADFEAYLHAQDLAEKVWKNKRQWAQKSLVNIAHSERFDADKTIERYASEIWHLDKVEIKEKA